MSQQPPRPGLNIQGVPPSPTPWSVSVGHIEAIVEDPITGERKVQGLVQFVCSDPTGVKIQFWEPDQAKKVANDILAHAYQAKTRLTIPGNAHVINPDPVPEEVEDGKRDKDTSGD